MSVTEILAAVRKLGEREKNEFLAGLGEIDFHDAWDRQIDADIKAGKLDRLAEEALAEHRAGQTRPLPGDEK
jgi:hypothetical protein